MSNNTNLKKWEPGQSGNPAGRPKGSKNWSTVVKGLLEDDKLLAKLKKSGLYCNSSSTSAKTASEAIGIAILVKALEGDVKAAEWLRKTAYGDKVEIEDGGSPPVALVEFVNRGATIAFADNPENNPTLPLS